jgi:hypothetical protein
VGIRCFAIACHKRGLHSALPAALVAKVHDTSMGMIEKHYGAYIVDASGDLLRQAVVSMASATVAAIRRA